MRIPLFGGAYEGISTNTSSQQCINYYYEHPAPGESHQGAMLPVHGSTLFDTLVNTGDIRAMLYEPKGSLLYVVSDNDLYSVTSGAIETARDVLATTSGRVEMALNPTEQAIVTVDGNTGLHYDIATTTGADITDTEFPDAATTVAHINNRFLVNDPTTVGKFWWSDLGDGTSWDSASFGVGLSLTSTIQKILVDEDRVFLFGKEQSEVWYNKGTSTQVFDKFTQFETGIAAAGSAVVYDNSIVFLASSKRGQLEVCRVGDGYVPQVISTPELSRKWEQYSTVSDAEAFAMTIDGHPFYVLSFPTGNATFAYDASVQGSGFEWAQWSGAFSNDAPIRYYGGVHAFCSGWSGGTHIVGDHAETGKLFAISETVYTWASANMERQLTGPGIAAENEDRLRFARIQIDCEEGVIDSGDTGNDRQLTVYWSKDGGHTFSSGVSLDIGEAAVDEYYHRLIRRRLGSGRNWIFRVYSDSKRKLVVKGAWGRLAWADEQNRAA